MSRLTQLKAPKLLQRWRNLKREVFSRIQIIKF